MPVNLAVHGRIAEVLFDHPPVNAFDTLGWEAIPKLINEASANAAVRCVLIRAEGRGFCGGVDIKEMQAHPERIVQTQPRQLSNLQGDSRVRRAGGECAAWLCHRRRREYRRRVRCPDRRRRRLFLATGNRPRRHGRSRVTLAHVAPCRRCARLSSPAGKIPVEDAYRIGSVEKVVPLDRLKEEASPFAR